MPARAPDRPPFECRVRFPARLADARLAPADAPLPTNRGAQAPRSPEPHQGAHAPRPPEPEQGVDTPRSPEPVSSTPHSEFRIPQSIAEALAGLREEQAGRLREWQRAAVELAAAIATRVLHEKVEAGDLPMEAKVRDMLAELDADAPATVYLHPADLAALEARLAGGHLAPGRDAPKLVPDATLGRGDCRVESREAVLLSEVTRELQDIRDDLFRSFGHARS